MGLFGSTLEHTLVASVWFLSLAFFFGMLYEARNKTLQRLWKRNRERLKSLDALSSDERKEDQ